MCRYASVPHGAAGPVTAAHVFTGRLYSERHRPHTFYPATRSGWRGPERRDEGPQHRADRDAASLTPQRRPGSELPYSDGGVYTSTPFATGFGAVTLIDLSFGPAPGGPALYYAASAS